MKSVQRKQQQRKLQPKRNQSPQLKSEPRKRSRLLNWLFDLGEDSHMLAISIAFYYFATYIIYIIVFGLPCENEAPDSSSIIYSVIVSSYMMVANIFSPGTYESCDTYAESYRLAAFYMSCSYITLASLVLVWMNGSRFIEKTLAFVLFILICDNVAMALDAWQNLEEWNALNTIDYYIQLASDYVLLSIGALCLVANLYYRQRRSCSSVHYF
ncbi:TMhelix containing protein [Vibrio phage 1.091.O._10N.286.52.B12]|nr:TMhelix containing protein [Vibrio phage 1.091.O._10N.286.52.B12]